MTDVGIGSWPARRARMNPHTVALRQGERIISYAQLAHRVDALAAALHRLGAGPGDRIAYLGPNDIATFETLFAAGRLGAVFVPLNVRLSSPEVTRLLADSGARVLVYGPECAALVAALDRDEASALDQVVALGSAAPGALSYDELLAADQQPPQVDIALDDDALILYTSGTTGRPKGAVLTHGNLTFNTVNQLAQTDVLSQDVVLCTAPLFHVVGLGQVTLPTLFKGGTVVVAPRFDPAWLLGAIPEFGIAAFSAVPTMLQMLCDHPDFGAADLSSLRYLVYGGSPVNARVARAWIARGVALLQGYGLTEAAPGVLLAMPDGVAEHPTSAGVPQFFVDVGLRTADGTITTDAAGTGELLVRGPTVFRGYRNRAPDTESALAGGWLHTGDIVRLDDDGWGAVVDRIKDMIISGGENIYPAEVEAAIAEAPGVADCAVVGVPDERWGEVGLALVVPATGRAVFADEVRAHLDGRLARFKIPKFIHIVDALPRTASGKVRRADIRSGFDNARQPQQKEHA